MDTHIFSDSIKCFFARKHFYLVLSTVTCNDQKYNMFPANQADVKAFVV